jgi:hypothetical protein
LKTYILDSAGNLTPESDIVKWAKWFETADRNVEGTATGSGTVSTVFLGVDHCFSGEGPPILWETTVFDGPFSNEQERCSGSIRDAKAMHWNMVAKLVAFSEAKAIKKEAGK